MFFFCSITFVNNSLAPNGGLKMSHNSPGLSITSDEVTREQIIGQGGRILPENEIRHYGNKFIFFPIHGNSLPILILHPLK